MTVRASGLSKSFRSAGVCTDVLSDLDVSFAAGEMSFLVGPSGCGKTTLISILGGLLRPDAGAVEVFGARFDRLTGSRLTMTRGRLVGFVFQQFNLVPALDAADNAALPLIIQNVPSTVARRRACDLLARLGMADHVAKHPAQLSGGQQQRVAIARALIHSPSFIVCDEPTASLDAETGRQVMTLLRDEARSADRVVVVVTHDDRIFPYSDRILRMADGRLLAPSEIAA